MLKKLKGYMMPIAMIVGGVFYKEVSTLGFLTPYLIAIMLFFTYCNISFKEIRFTKFHCWLLLFQVFGAVGIYLILIPINVVLAQGAMICVLAPTGTAAPVITRMLGGNVESLTAYSLLCNLVIAILSPICFALVGNIEASSFISSILIIAQKTVVLLLGPFIVAYLLYKLAPKIQQKAKALKSISFYLWTFALIIITGKTVFFVMKQDSDSYHIEIGLAIIALIICLFQFLCGRRIGKFYSNTIAGGQGLGQKNTILAIWMAQTFLNPITSIAPGAYVLWQNLVNSFQVWKARKTI